MEATRTPTSTTSATRRLAVDWLRGAVMVLMTWDHASAFFNAARVSQDSPVMYKAGTSLPALGFALRWITHLCAPTFVFLAGVALALSYTRRERAGETETRFDRDLLVRGAVLLAIELIVVQLAVGELLFQVLYAIAMGLWAMIVLRRLPPRWLVGAALAWWIGSEALTMSVWDGHSAHGGGLVTALLVSFATNESCTVMYPALPWISVMALGWATGRRWFSAGDHNICASRRIRFFIAVGLGCLALFVLVRGLNGYGNMGLLRADPSLVQWLNVSKYPPSLSFMTLELGLAALVLAAGLGWERRGGPGRDHLLTVFGQTALFYYVFHVVFLSLAANVLAIRSDSLTPAVTMWVITMAVGYPVCRVFRATKRRYPQSWLRYV